MTRKDLFNFVLLPFVGGMAMGYVVITVFVL